MGTTLRGEEFETEEDPAVYATTPLWSGLFNDDIEAELLHFVGLPVLCC